MVLRILKEKYVALDRTIRGQVRLSYPNSTSLPDNRPGVLDAKCPKLLDKRLTFKYHIENVITKAEKTIKILYTFLHRKSKLNLKNKLFIYYCFIRPLLIYACPVWNKIAKIHLKSLQVLQNKVLKMIVNVPPWFRTSTLHSYTNTELLTSIIVKHNSKYRVKCNNSTCQEIRELNRI